MIGLWLLVTAINLFKAFHIDDSFHLEAAQWIMNHWTEPLSGHINWDNNTKPMYNSNHPVLFFYLIAIVGSVFSFGEVPLHILLSVFSFLALHYFYKSLKALYPASNLLPLVLFAVCPAFIVNQNLMIDVPLVALMLGFVYHFILANNQKPWANYVKAALFLSACLMIKYTVLPLCIVFVVVLLLRRDFKMLVTLLIPIGVLLLWSWWNMAEFGGVHLLNRSTSEFSAKSFGNGLLSFFGCMAAILPWYLLLLLGSWKSKYSSLIFTGVVSNAITLALLVASDLTSVKTSDGILNITFTLLGMAMVVHLVYLLIREYKEHRLVGFIKQNFFFMSLSVAGLSLFVILFAPFMATRHLLLIVPFIILLSVPVFTKVSLALQLLIVGCVTFLGVAIGISDWQYAQFYKSTAKLIVPKANGAKVWAVGHWGWQWYCVQQGAEVYNTNALAVKVGDCMAVPLNISSQDIHPSLELLAIDSLYTEGNAMTFVSVANHGSMYTSRYKKPAWNFSKAPMDTVVLYKVVDVNFAKLKAIEEKMK